MSGWTNPNVQSIVPLSQAGSISGATNAAVLTPGQTYVPLNLQNVSQFASYDLNLYTFCTNSNVVNAPLVTLVQLIWYDDLVSGMPVFEEDWWIWTGRASINFANTITPNVATGPMHGRYMSIIVSNTGSGAGNNLTVQYMNVFGSNRPSPMSDWRQNADLVNPQSNGISLISSSVASQTSYENCIGVLGNIPLGLNSTQFLPLSLYAGPVYYRLQCTGTAAGADPVICSALGFVSGDITVGTANKNVLVNITNDTAEHEGQFIAPRTPCFLALKGGATTTTVSCIFIGQQGA